MFVLPWFTEDAEFYSHSIYKDSVELSPMAYVISRLKILIMLVALQNQQRIPELWVGSILWHSFNA